MILLTQEFEDGDLVRFMYYALTHDSSEDADIAKEQEQFPGRGVRVRERATVMVSVMESLYTI